MYAPVCNIWTLHTKLDHFAKATKPYVHYFVKIKAKPGSIKTPCFNPAQSSNPVPGSKPCIPRFQPCMYTNQSIPIHI